MNAIETFELTRKYGDATVLDDLTLSIKQGTILGFLGPNGAGKTTTLNLLIGLIAPTSGQARVLGFDSTREAQRVRERIGVLLEDHGLYEYLSAYDNLEFFGRVNKMSKLERARRIQELMEKVGLWEKRDQQVKEWSKGMKQKLAICRALLHQPKILFLDEPTSGLDPASQRMVREEILDLKASENVTIFLNTHNLDEAERVCDEIAIINKGRLITRGTPDEIKTGATTDGHILITIDSLPAEAEAELNALPFVKTVTTNGQRLQVITDTPMRSAEINRLLVSHGVAVSELHRQQASLEEIFVQLVEEERHDA
ncbi:MAG: ABC transporter ATP-binding protein [Acidobacteria bacterium]|nr:ABC transporter ATP-binding protein [Acidobacteriota bacterium]